jgi:hypothetical protein
MATMPVTLAAVPVVFWLNVGHVNVPVLKSPDVGVPRAGVTKDGDVDNTTDPEPVDVVTPVPPLATFSVPARVTAPDVALDGEKPVVPALNVVTPVDGAFAHDGTPAAKVRICPLVPAAKNVVVDVALW